MEGWTDMHNFKLTTTYFTQVMLASLVYHLEDTVSSSDGNAS